jgi:putative DNA primase/helicase
VEAKMSEVKGNVGPEWTARIEETFEALKWAEREIQERACKAVQEEFSSEEAATKLRQLFGAEADRMRAAFFVPAVQPGIENKGKGKPKDEPKEPVVGGFRRRIGGPYRGPSQEQILQNILKASMKPKPVLKVVEQRKPEEEPEEEEEFEPQKEADDVGEEGRVEKVRLNLSAPYDIAKIFVRMAEDGEGKKRYVFIGKVGGRVVAEPILRRWKNDFKWWNGQYYEDVDDEDIRTQVYEFLNNAVEPSGGRLKPRQKHVNEVIDGLKSGTNPGGRDAPFWMRGRKGPEPRGLLVCRNGLLELGSGRLWEHDPRLFCLNGVDFDFDPRARAPRWERFLGEVWPGDEEAVGTLQEFFGLWLTDVTKYQKALGLFGRPRSGKGTVGRIVKGLLSTTSFTSVSLMDLGDKFGMEHLIGKKLALVPDVKLDGRMNITTIMQRLLETIGEDPQAINRKNQKFWEGTLGIRWLILGNDVPKFRGTDEAGALAARMVMLKMDQSFLGKEDWDLTDKLLAERAGILNWAMEGWRRLQARDRFVQPGSGMDLLQTLRANTSTIGMFVTECCELGTEFRIDHATLWAAFCEWSERRRVSLTFSTQTFSGALHEVFAGVSTSRPRAGMPDNRPPHQCGIKLKSGWCTWR